MRDALAPYSDRIVRQSMEIRGGQVRITLIAIGDRSANEAALASLRADIKRRTGTTPRIDAIYVPDADALALLAASVPSTVSLQPIETPTTPTTTTPPTPTTTTTTTTTPPTPTPTP